MNARKALTRFLEAVGPAAESTSLGPREIATILRPYVSDRRAARIEEVLTCRTRHVVPVLEGLYDAGNMSAIQRTAEALGYAEVHVIPNAEPMRHSRRASQASEKWIDLVRWPTTQAALAGLRASGYRVYVAHHRSDAMDLQEVPLDGPLAVVFGNERDGLSAQMIAAADGSLSIEQRGFTESLNVSVAAGIILHALRRRLNEIGHAAGDLPEEERALLRAVYYLQSVKAADALVRQALLNSAQI